MRFIKFSKQRVDFCRHKFMGLTFNSGEEIVLSYGRKLFVYAPFRRYYSILSS